MKIIFNLFLIMITLLQISYDGVTEPKNKEQEAPTYFPLSIGNKWYYKYWDHFDSAYVYPESIIMTEEVISKRELANRSFYLVEMCYFNLDGTVRAKDSIYYNFSSDTLYQILNNWEFSEASLSIRAIFADTGHVSYQMKWYDDYYKAYSRLETDSTMNFVLYKPNRVDSGSEWKFKKNIGIFDYISYQTVGKRLVKYEFY